MHSVLGERLSIPPHPPPYPAPYLNISVLKRIIIFIIVMKVAAVAGIIIINIISPVVRFLGWIHRTTTATTTTIIIAVLP
jgi:hypothetical protein